MGILAYPLPLGCTQGFEDKDPQPKKSEIKALSLEDVKTLLSTAETEGHRLLALYALAVATGLRHGELLGLRWKDVDLEESGGRVRVKKPLVRTRAKRDGGKGYDFDDPKTKRARAVSFGPGAAKALRTHRARQNEERLRFGPAYEETGLVFTEEWGGLLPIWKSLRLLHDLALRAGIEKRFGFRELRHTAATLSFAEGARGKEVQEMLGHASIRQTMDTYTDLIPTIQEQAAKRLDSALFG